MTEKHWAVCALSDIRNALDQDRYDVAVCHITDAIAAIEARDDQGDDGYRDDRYSIDSHSKSGRPL